MTQDLESSGQNVAMHLIVLQSALLDMETGLFTLETEPSHVHGNQGTKHLNWCLRSSPQVHKKQILKNLIKKNKK